MVRILYINMHVHKKEGWLRLVKGLYKIDRHHHIGCNQIRAMHNRNHVPMIMKIHPMHATTQQTLIDMLN